MQQKNIPPSTNNFVAVLFWEKVGKICLECTKTYWKYILFTGTLIQNHFNLEMNKGIVLNIRY